MKTDERRIASLLAVSGFVLLTASQVIGERLEDQMFLGVSREFASGFLAGAAVVAFCISIAKGVKALSR